MSLKPCGVVEATHVKILNGEIRKIQSKWGVGPEGQLETPSKGGFGVVTEDGMRVGMMEALAYYEQIQNYPGEEL